MARLLELAVTLSLVVPTTHHLVIETLLQEAGRGREKPSHICLPGGRIPMAGILKAILGGFGDAGLPTLPQSHLPLALSVRSPHLTPALWHLSQWSLCK